MTAALRSLVVAALLCAGPGCFRYPQRWPGPLPLAQEPVTAELTGAPPARAATVQRDSDPVWVRRPGARDDYPLPFYDKREHLEVGALSLTLMTLSGTYVAPRTPMSSDRYNEPDYTMAVAVIEGSGDPFYVKIVGPSATMTQWSPSIDALWHSLTP